MLAGLVAGNSRHHAHVQRLGAQRQWHGRRQAQQHLAARPDDAVGNDANACLPVADGGIEFAVDGRAGLRQHRKGSGIGPQRLGQRLAQAVHIAALVAQCQKMVCHGDSPFKLSERLCSPEAGHRHHKHVQCDKKTGRDKGAAAQRPGQCSGERGLCHPRRACSKLSRARRPPRFSKAMTGAG